jgi:TPR repeat protein
MRHGLLILAGLVALLPAALAAKSTAGAAAQKIPVLKAISLFERQIKQQSQPDKAVFFAMGRLLALSAINPAAVVLFDAVNDAPLFPATEPLLPRKKHTKKLPEKQQDQLRRAFAYFQRAQKAGYEDCTISYAIAWTIERYDNVNQHAKEAIDYYRKAVRLGWSQEALTKSFHGVPPVTLQAAEHLVEALDRVKDSAEIADLKKMIEQLRKHLGKPD